MTVDTFCNIYIGAGQPMTDVENLFNSEHSLPNPCDQAGGKVDLGLARLSRHAYPALQTPVIAFYI